MSDDEEDDDDDENENGSDEDGIGVRWQAGSLNYEVSKSCEKI